MRSISSKITAAEAIKMGFKIKIIEDKYDIFSVKGKGKTIIFKNIDCGLNSGLGVKFANQKKVTYVLLKKHGIPTPESMTLTKNIFEKDGISNINFKFPLVVKPAIGSHGDGVVVNIKNNNELINGIKYAMNYKNEVIIQEFLKGEDYRIVVINHKFIAAMKRIPAHIIADGKNSIKALIEKENNNPDRGDGHEKGLSKISIDDEAIVYLKDQGYTLDSIPTKGQTVYLRKNANLSTGGISVDVTDDVHPEIKKICEKASKAVCLKVCGIDYLSEDIKKPLKEQTGGIIEINHTPGLRGHHFPTIGKPRNIAKEILKLAFSK